MQQPWMMICAAGVFASTAAVAQNAVPVTVDNFKRAETDHYLAMNVKDAGGLGKLHHSREPADIDKQTVIRMNRDTCTRLSRLTWRLDRPRSPCPTQANASCP